MTIDIVGNEYIVTLDNTDRSKWTIADVAAEIAWAAEGMARFA